MDIKKAAHEMIQYVLNSALSEKHPECGKIHLLEMISKIENSEITGEKAYRWLGWIQGCVCVTGGATLEQMKNINFMS